MYAAMAASKWNGTIHDISHLATSYPAGFFAIENLEWVIGYHNDAKFDEKLGGVRMKAYIRHDSPKYKVWKNYVEICKASGRVPNTSMFGYAKYGTLSASELPKGVNVPEGLTDSKGNVLCLKDFQPAAVTTCLRGKCDDKDGCGIDIANNGCSSGSCNIDNNNSEEEEEKPSPEPEPKNKRKVKVLKRKLPFK